MNIYNIPAQYQFTKNLVDKLFAINNNDIFKISKYLILLPSRRACRNLKDAILIKNNYKPILLPSIYPLGEIDEEELDFDNFTDNNLFSIPDPISKIEQKILFTSLIREYYPNKSLPETISLATELQNFLIESQKEQIDLTKLDKIYPEDFAIHWQKILDFLKILYKKWPKILKDRNLIDQFDRRNKIIEQRARLWQEQPPSFPIIAAGSTGSLPSTSIILKTIANLDNGTVILPGLDQFMDDLSWKNIDEFHPQFGLKNLIKYIGIERDKIENWLPPDPVSSSNFDRSKFLSGIMRPAITSSAWLKFKQLDIGTLKNISWINLENMQQEADVISTIFRENVEYSNKKIALVTSDISLARRVSQLVRRWNIEIEYSNTETLKDSSIGVYLRLVLNMIKSDYSSIDLLAFLKHPVTNLKLEKELFKNILSNFEISILRRNKINGGIEEIKNFLMEINDISSLNLINIISETFSELSYIFKKKTISFKKILHAHFDILKTVYNLEMDITTNANIIMEFQEFFSKVNKFSHLFGSIDPKNYSQIFENLLSEEIYTKPYLINPRLAILSPMEARMHNFDVIILGGLNEGIWPKHSDTNPWMSRNMRNELGLPSTEKKIGQSAHDFYMLSHAKEVIFTRSIKIDGTVTVPSRWIQRINTVLKSAGIRTNNFNVKPWIKWIKLMNTPDHFISIKSPKPKPNINLRPTKFSVTEIEKLIRNPYSIYANRILKLKAIDEITEDLKPRDFGNFIHKSIENYSNYDNADHESDYDLLIKCSNQALGNMTENPVVKHTWIPRFERIAEWLIRNNHLPKNIDSFSEIKGSYVLLMNKYKYVLSSKADRIEIEPDQTVNIIDYKTGTLPSNQNINNGISSQVILEAMIAKYSGYFCQNKYVKYKIGELKYIRLTGGEEIGEVKNISGDIEVLIEQAIFGLKNLFRIFREKDTAYLYCPNPNIEPRYDEYRHLSRVLEWIE